MAGYGISTTHNGDSIELPGFLFDMNLLFQEGLGRFLRDWLVDGKVAEQYRLTDIFRYQPLFNPRRKHPYAKAGLCHLSRWPYCCHC
jgi:hypothetical protein